MIDAHVLDKLDSSTKGINPNAVEFVPTTSKLMNAKRRKKKKREEPSTHKSISKTTHRMYMEFLKVRKTNGGNRSMAKDLMQN